MLDSDWSVVAYSKPFFWIIDTRQIIMHVWALFLETNLINTAATFVSLVSIVYILLFIHYGFYPKRLTVHSGYTFVLSVCVFPGNRTHNLCAANVMLYHWATGTRVWKQYRRRGASVEHQWTAVRWDVAGHMWPWTTKPVIRGNFFLLRFMHNLKADK